MAARSGADPTARFPYRQPDPEPGPPGNGSGVPPWLEERLFDRRIVILSGLSAAAASQATVSLMTLDVIGVGRVQLHVTAIEGELSAAFAVVDAIASMRAPVDAVVPSQAGGAALAVLAAARRRIAFPHARLRLAEPHATVPSGTAEKVAGAAGEYLRELDELIVRLAEVTGQPRSRIEDDLSVGRVLSAVEAREYGLIDEIVGRVPDG